MPSIEELDIQIADIGGQIATAMQAGGGSPDYSPFYKSPGYQFRMDEGTRAFERSAAAKGKLMSGGLLRELTSYGQGLASSEFNSYANRLASMAGIGQTATQYTGQLGASAAGQYGATSGQLSQTIMSGGQAQASGYIGSSNALMQGYAGAIDAFWDDDEDGGGTRGWQSQPYSGTAYNWY
jgi:hypothetical protein